MRLVIQRVSKAKVVIKDTSETVGEIRRGLFVLIGVGEGDTQEKAEKLAKKLANLRIMSDEKGKMNLSVTDTETELLVVSQFTLLGDTRKGNRPSFVKAGDPGHAERIYDHFVAQLRKLEVKVETGEFGAYMKIDVTLDGPVTILME
jgi:D-tyrosyl-tRNA(Tyr) deacylase